MSAVQRSIDESHPAAAPPWHRSEVDFLRFCAGARALLALLGSIALFGHWDGRSPLLGAVVLAYLLFSAVLLDRLLGGRPAAASRHWLWADAAFIGLVAVLMDRPVLWLPLVAVAPVVAMSLLAGPVQALLLALATAAGLLLAGVAPAQANGTPLLSALPLLMLAVAPAAAYLALSGRSLRARRQLLEELQQRSDARHGLLSHVDVLLDLLHTRFGLSASAISLQGLDPRVFRRVGVDAATLLDNDQAEAWRARRSALPAHAGCLESTRDGRVARRFIGLDGRAGARHDEPGPTDATHGEPESLLLPLMSYGRPLGHLWLGRRSRPFVAADLHWLHELMREALPLLERSDLLEQLQRETAARERERIGRDMHDSAVQPYLGLKYGLEALARQAGPHHDLAPDIAQLVELTTQELAVLRDVVSGLRNRCETVGGGFPAALRRQAARFEALYGLKVTIAADDCPPLRGAAAKALLHMVNEALTNVRRHTPASAVDVNLGADGDALVLRVRNDLGPARPDGTPAAAFRPRSLCERSSEMGGHLQVDRSADHTEITIKLPMLATMR